MSIDLQQLKNKMENFNPDNYTPADGITKESLQEKYDRCKEVYDTIKTRELTLLWFLRHSRKGIDMLFLDAAELNYKAHQAKNALYKTE